MAAKQQAKLTEKLMKKQALEAKKKEDEGAAVEGVQGAEKPKAKRQRVSMPIPQATPVIPSVVKQPAGVLLKGSSSVLPPKGDKGKAATEVELTEFLS
ncbi:double-strand break repair helicase AddA [Sesbania bispinosa]|nr:double-strand break repair helicase AddA [Sesbania bispinosa]